MGKAMLENKRGHHQEFSTQVKKKLQQESEGHVKQAQAAHSRTVVRRGLIRQNKWHLYVCAPWLCRSWYQSSSKPPHFTLEVTFCVKQSSSFFLLLVEKKHRDMLGVLALTPVQPELVSIVVHEGCHFVWLAPPAETRQAADQRGCLTNWTHCLNDRLVWHIFSGKLMNSNHNVNLDLT